MADKVLADKEVTHMLHCACYHSFVPVRGDEYTTHRPQICEIGWFRGLCRESEACVCDASRCYREKYGLLVAPILFDWPVRGQRCHEFDCGSVSVDVLGKNHPRVLGAQGRSSGTYSPCLREEKRKASANLE